MAADPSNMEGVVVEDITSDADVSVAIETVRLAVKWNGNAYELQMSPHNTVGEMKGKLSVLTNVLPERQKLAGLKFQGKVPGDEVRLEEMGIKDGHKVMMVGVAEADTFVDPVDRANLPEVVNDLDFDYTTATSTSTSDPAHNPDNLKKLKKRVDSCEIRFINPPRRGKKLCVLDLDYTLFDMKGEAPDVRDQKRPFLDEFMAAVYQNYDIVVWSQTSWMWLEMKLTDLGLLTSDNFKICFVLDKTNMFSIVSHFDGADHVHEVKALELIWRQLPDYSAANTVHVDDLSRNFAMNPRQGVKIKAYKHYKTNRSSDRELQAMARYLTLIAAVDDFNTLDHKRWKEYLMEH